MLLRELLLVNFRNYVRLALAPGEGVTVLRGDNGQGKSNILEAVYFLATTRSTRAGSDRELVHWHARRDPIPFARLEARIARAHLDLHVEILIRAEADPGGSIQPLRGPRGPGPTSHGQDGAVPSVPPVAKKIRVNGLPTRPVDLVGQVNVVLFTPDDVALVAGPPAGRRRYLDVTNSQVSGLYLRTLQRYKRVLDQRNHLLRQVRERRQPRDSLDFWNSELVQTGTSVIAGRLEMMAKVNRELGPLYRRLSGSQQTLAILYQPTSPIPEPAEPPTGQPDAPELAPLRERYAARVTELLGKEIDQGVSLVGPHRDDFSFVLDGIDLNTYGSRGQQRLAVLALKLAEGQYMRGQTGERPILLLDDVLSELDPPRRGFVLDHAGREGQTIITATDLADFPAELLDLAAVYRVERGAVSGLEEVADDAPSASDMYAIREVPAQLRRVAE